MKTKVFSSVFYCIILFFAFVLPHSAQTTVVKGKLLDLNGKPSKMAMIGIIQPYSQNAKEFVNCDAEGNYKLELKSPGVNTLLFSMPHHNGAKTIIINNKQKEVTVNVKLAAYSYKDNFDNASVAGDFNGFNISAPEKMTKQSDGTYTFEIKSENPKVKYQLCRITASERTVNGTDSGEFEPDSSGDYRSIIPVKDGKATVVFDPKKLITGGEQKIEIIGAEFDKIIGEEVTAINKISEEASAKLSKHYQAFKNFDNFNYDSGDFLNVLAAKIENAKDKELQEIYKLAYVQMASFKMKGYDFGKAAQFFDSVPPSSMGWSIFPGSFFTFYSIFPQYRYNEIQDKFLKEATDNTIRLSIYRGRLANAKFSGNQAELEKLHDVITKEFGDLQGAKDMLKQYPTVSKIKVGAEIPDFETVSLDNPAEKFSKKNMLGKIYLIDFWATWCGPCVGEMKSLHDAYEKFKGKGFEIISLSQDGSPDDVAKFRKGDWPMPWKNSFINNADGIKISKNFEVIGIPRPILVSAEGKILAMEGELRGANLQTTLAKYFK